MVMVHAPSAHDAGVDPGDDGNRSDKDVAGGQEEVNYFRPPDQATEKELRCGKTKASCAPQNGALFRSEEHTSELQSLMRTSYAVFCLQKQRPHLKNT